MIKRIFAAVLLTPLLLSPLSAQIKIKAAVKKQNITIFPFIPIDDSGKYKYLSAIIPLTLSKSLSKSNLYDVTLGENPLEVLSPAASQLQKKEYIKKLQEMQEVTKDTNYVITGFCELKEEKTDTGEKKPDADNDLKETDDSNKTLNIKVQILDMYTYDSAFLELSSKETGVILKETIDELQAKVDKQLASFEVINKKLRKPSPLLKAYNKVFNRFEIGIEVGEFFIFDEWGDLYNDSEYIKPYLNFDIIKYLGVTISYDYFATDNDSMDFQLYSTMEISSFNAGVYGQYKFVHFMDVSAHMTSGISITTIRFPAQDEDGGGGSPFQNPISKEGSINANLAIGASVGFHFFSIDLRIGTSYKRIFYNETNMHGMTVYGSLGYHF